MEKNETYSYPSKSLLKMRIRAECYTSSECCLIYNGALWRDLIYFKGDAVLWEDEKVFLFSFWHRWRGDEEIFNQSSSLNIVFWLTLKELKEDLLLSISVLIQLICLNDSWSLDIGGFLYKMKNMTCRN